VYGICHLSIVSCRKEPANRSELVTQLLFGEHFTVLEQDKEWSRIQNESDSYECWINNKQFLPIGVNTFNRLCSHPRFLSTELVQVLGMQNGSALPILLGSTLPLFKDGICLVEEFQWNYEGQSIRSTIPVKREALVETAMLYLHAPYLWGGRSPFGIDCSGFTQLVYKLNGKQLKRDAYEQASEGKLLSFVEEAHAGDLAFFDNEEGKIIHTGIILDDNRIIHASGKVRVDAFDHHGIYNATTKTYSHNLRMIRNMMD
jgi:hypothetical protein